jgi:C1A family cysteine protease
MNSKTFITFSLFAGSASAKFHTDSLSTQKYLWENFKAEHRKSYAGEDEEHFRFNIFVDNLKLIDERNSKDTAIHGITKFTDMSPAEFKMTHLNYNPHDRAYLLKDVSIMKSSDNETQPLLDGEDIIVDWTGKYTTPVKDQGYCGSCWAFSATEQIESDYMRSSGKEAILSAQQMTSCTHYFIAGGCNGGSTEKAFEYASKGLELDADYPYTSGKAGVTGSCSADSSKFVVKATGYTTVSNSASDESKMASFVGSTGPLSVCVDASEWSSYTGGILSNCGNSVDHCVQAVGIDTAAGYWKVRNSWGTSWGESGFIRLAYGANTCEIASDANYATTAAVTNK